jgi:hypothetical protein
MTSDESSVSRPPARFKPRSVGGLLALTDSGLARVDPVEMNLVVAQGIPALAELDIYRYQEMADRWAEDIRRGLPGIRTPFFLQSEPVAERVKKCTTPLPRIPIPLTEAYEVTGFRTSPFDPRKGYVLSPLKKDKK